MTQQVFSKARMTDEEKEAMALEGIAPLESDDARLDLIRRYNYLSEERSKLNSEMEDIKALLKEDALSNDIREFRYNGNRVVSLNNKHTRKTDLAKLLKEFPTAYEETVSESTSLSINFSKIKE